MKELMISVHTQSDGSFLITAENDKVHLRTTAKEKFIILKVIYLQFQVWLRSVLFM